MSNRKDNHLPPDKTGIVDSGEINLYIAPNAPYGKIDTTENQTRVRTANGQVESSTAMAALPISKFNADFPTKLYIMPTFTNTLIVVGPIFDANFTVVFRKEDITVMSPQGKPIIQVWREDKFPRL